MARSLEARIERLEQASGWRQIPDHGVLSVDLSDSLRAVAFRSCGFDLEKIDQAAWPGVPRVCVDGIDFNAVVARVKGMVALQTKMQALERRARAKLAPKHGYRVIYPPEDGGGSRASRAVESSATPPRAKGGRL